MDLCVYGCGQEAKFTFKNGKKCCSEVSSQCPAQKDKISLKIKKAHASCKENTGNLTFVKGIKVVDCDFNVGVKNVCFYCGEYAAFQLKNGRWCCEDSSNKCRSVREKNKNGVKLAHKECRCREFTSADRQWWLHKSDEEVSIIRKKQGKTYSDRVKSGEIIPSGLGRKTTIETKQKMSNSASERNNGFVKTKYYKIFSPYMDKEVSVQGSWEFKFAQYLNDNNIEWERSKTKHLNYKLSQDDYIHSYYPDFFLPKTREYIEIKGYWWKSKDGRVDDRRKMDKVIECNLDKHIIILQKEDLEKLGIVF